MFIGFGFENMDFYVQLNIHSYGFSKIITMNIFIVCFSFYQSRS